MPTTSSTSVLPPVSAAAAVRWEVLSERQREGERGPLLKFVQE